MSGHMSYTAPRASVNPRRIDAEREFDLGCTILHELGTETVDEFIGGTPLGKVTASGKYRPCFKTRVSGTQTAVTEVDVDNSLNAYVGDEVEFVSASTGAVIATKTLTAVDKTSSTHTVSFAGAIDVTDDDVVQLTNGAETCVGILTGNVWAYRPYPTTRYDPEGVMLRSGSVYASLCRGVGDLIQADLPRVFFDD